MDILHAGLALVTTNPRGFAQKHLPASFSTAGEWPEAMNSRQLDGPFNPFRPRTIGPDGFEVGALSTNSAIYACINTVATASMEPPLEVWREAPVDSVTGEWSKLRRHKIRGLLKRPNPRYDNFVGTSCVGISMKQMTWLNQWFKHIDGNAYWYKVRLEHPVYGRVDELWPLDPSQVRPRNRNDELIDRGRWDLVRDPRRRVAEWYEYDPGISGRDPIKIDPENIIHFRLGVDPQDMRLGLGPVKQLAREVATDRMAGIFTHALLRNFSIPGLLVVPAEGTVEPEEAQQIKERMRSEFSGGNTGGIAVLSAGATVQQFGYDPERMTLAAIHRHCETRIASVMNVPAIVAQLGSGIDQSSQFSNFHEAREMFAEDTMLPIWTADGEALTDQLLPDFSTRDDERLGYDLDQVRALQQDVTAKYGRLQVAVKGGWLTANEARAAVGLPGIDLKDGQVPLTQGEDNRYNDLVAQGLVTLNEARESVGLPPVPGGEQLLSEFKARQGATNLQISQEGMRAAGIDPQQALTPPGPNRPPGSPIGAQGSKPGQEPRDNSRGATPPLPSEQGRQGANVTTPKTKSLWDVVAVLTEEEVFEMFQKAREAGTSILDVEYRSVE